MNPFRRILFWYWNTKREWIQNAVFDDMMAEHAAQEFVREYIVTPQMLDDIQAYLDDQNPEDPQ